ncbi:MAG: DUF6580 family putative transport protein [Flavobacteriales bacterium]
MINSRNIFILVLILLVAGLRIAGVLPYNFTPVAAIALFGAAMFSNRALGFILPLAIMFVSDMFIGLHSSMIAVYGAFVGVAFIGQWVRKNPTMLKALGGALAGSILFFLVTNAAAWLVMPEYTKDFSGLMASYAAGIPFYRGTLAGDLLFTTVLFGSYKLAGYRFPTLVKA